MRVQTHAASLIELKDGKTRAFWFSGSREGARDVAIHSAVFDPQTKQWSREEIVATRQSAQRSLRRYVSKLGNPVCARAPGGELWVFYVTVSVGGWSGSSVSMQSSKDDGETWSGARRLITSPFLNLGTLVKGAPFYYADGTVGLPIYHELFGKMGEIARLDANGQLLYK